MTFKITIERAPIGVEFEVGSIAEAISILEQEDSNLRKVVSIGDSLAGEPAPVATGETEGTTETTKGKRGRPAKDKNQPDPATATAPPPLAIPGAPPTAPVDTAAVNANGMPAFLDRTGAAAPPPPPPPPAAPVAPPSGILAGKVIAECDRRATDEPNKKMLADWLVSYGLVNAGSSYDESIAALRLMPDDKLGQVAVALAVA
jgi:hypothetical protein